MNLTTARSVPVKPLPAAAEDRVLAARLARGETAALDQFVERYGRRVLGLATRLLGWSEGADDVAQEVFMSLLARPAQFRGESTLWTYLATLTVNRCRSVRRRRWVQQRVLRVVGLTNLGKARSPEQPAVEQDETAQKIRRAVAQLPAAYREVVVLRYFEDMTIDEVARALGQKRNAIDVRLSRARGLLEESLGGFMG